NDLTRHVDRVDDRRSLLPLQLKLALTRHRNMQFLFRLQLVRRSRLGRTWNVGISLNARHVIPNRRSDQKQYETQEEVDEGDERDLVVGGALTVMTTCVNTSHWGLPWLRYLLGENSSFLETT